MTVNISYVEHTDALNNNNMWATLDGWKNTDISFKNIDKFIKRSNIQYSPYSFSTGRKLAEYWSNDKQNLLVFDIDDGLGIDEAMKILNKYEYMISTTKSHQKEKKHIITDRYRILMPSINIPKGEILFNVMDIFSKVIPIDKQVNTKTGAFLGNDNATSIYHSGKIYDCKPLIKEAEYILLQQMKEASKKRKTKVKGTNTLKINEIKNLLTTHHLKDILEDLGYETIGRRVKLREERTASAVLYDNGKIIDYGSGYSDDIFGLLYDKFGMTFKDSIPFVQKYIEED